MITIGEWVAIRVFSDMNEWIDMCFLVRPEQGAEAVFVIEDAYDKYWTEETEDYCIGDWIMEALEKAHIEFKGPVDTEQ